MGPTSDRLHVILPFHQLTLFKPFKTLDRSCRFVCTLTKTAFNVKQNSYLHLLLIKESKLLFRKSSNQFTLPSYPWFSFLWIWDKSKQRFLTKMMPSKAGRGRHCQIMSLSPTLSHTVTADICLHILWGKKMQWFSNLHYVGRGSKVIVQSNSAIRNWKELFDKMTLSKSNPDVLF